MFTTAVRIERDLGVPSVSLNTLTGHRSCAPRIAAGKSLTCRRGRYRFQASFRQAPYCTFWRLGFRQSCFRHIARISRLPPHTPGHELPVYWHAIFPYILSDSG